MHVHKLFYKQPLLGAVLWSVLWSVYCNISCDKILQRDWGALYIAPGQFKACIRSSPDPPLSCGSGSVLRD